MEKVAGACQTIIRAQYCPSDDALRADDYKTFMPSDFRDYNELLMYNNAWCRHWLQSHWV